MNRFLVVFILSFFIMLSQVGSLQAYDEKGLSEEDERYIDKTIHTFMQRYTIPGLSIALAKGDEFILARGYGYADTKRKLEVSTAHQFRIASLSKPITSVAIMMLVEQGKLSLDDRVFGPGGLLSFPVSRDNRYVGQITIRHLLTHSAAPEWTNDRNGPMFIEMHLDKEALVRHVLKTRILKKAPGTSYAYSNFGYCILGLVIEKLTGMSYEAYVKKTVFKPAGINSFVLGSKKARSTPLEVTYYPHSNSEPYEFPVRRMDAHGGWIANAIDIVKFIQHSDGRPNPADLLSADSIKIMTEPSPLNRHYSMGWSVNQYNNWWHTGGLPGTASILVRTEHGYAWAVLANKGSDDKNFNAELDGLTWKLLEGIGL